MIITSLGITLLHMTPLIERLAGIIGNIIRIILGKRKSDSTKVLDELNTVTSQVLSKLEDPQRGCLGPKGTGDG